MPGVVVPRRQQAGFLAIRDLSDDEFDAIRDALAAADPLQHATIHHLVRRVTDAVPSLDSGMAVKLVRSLLSVQAGRTVHGDSLPEFAQGIASSEDLKVDSDVVPVLARRIEALAQIQVVAVVAKAMDVAREYDRVFHTSRIMTDMRPVFGEDAEAPPGGTIVTHVLRIDAFHNGELEDYYVALTTDHLRSLFDVVDRAMKKSKSLGLALDAMGFSRFDVSTEEEAE